MVCIQFKLVTVTLGTFTLIFPFFLHDLSGKLLAISDFRLHYSMNRLVDGRVREIDKARTRK